MLCSPFEGAALQSCGTALAEFSFSRRKVGIDCELIVRESREA